MELNLRDKIKSIDIVNIVNTLLTEYVSKGKLKGTYKDVSYLKSINAFTDYTREFLDMYFNDFTLNIDKNAKDYILNRLYEAKGGLQIFDILNSLLSVHFNTPEDPSEEDDSVYNIELGMEYSYQFPDLEVLDVNNLRVSDVGEFVKKLKNMVYVLLFYNSFNIIIRNIQLLIEDALSDYEFISVKPYYIHELTPLNDNNPPL